MTQQVDHEKRLALCLKDRECPGDGVAPSSVTDAAGYSLCPCTRCDDTGRTFLLDPDGEFGLRVKCLSCGGKGTVPYDGAYPPYSGKISCGKCGGSRNERGRGWTPSKGIGVLIDCLLDLGFQPKLGLSYSRRTVVLYQKSNNPWGGGSEGDSWEEALWSAL